MKKAMISLCDKTGFMGKDWLEAGYEVFLVDPQHKETRKEDGYTKIAGTVIESAHLIGQILRRFDVRFVAGFPPCTDVANSGSRWFQGKLQNDAACWARAAMVAEQCRMVALLSGAPGFFENPTGVFCNDSMFGSASFYFHPYEFGGYLPDDDVHPTFPNWINPRDAYTKKTGLWAFNGFQLPDKRPVPVPEGEAGNSKQYSQMGGDSVLTKDVRSATPRGFARACFLKYSC